MVTDEQTKEDARTHALEVLKNPVYSSLSAYKNISDSKDFGEIDNEVMDKTKLRKQNKTKKQEKEIKSKFALKEDEIESIFDLLEEEHPDL